MTIIIEVGVSTTRLMMRSFYQMFKAFLFVTALMGVILPQSYVQATEYDDRMLRAQEDQIDAKQRRMEEIAYHSEALQQKMTEDRLEIQKSQQRIQDEFMRSLDFERSEVQGKLEVLNERQRTFEVELEKKRAQDEIRIKERENELQRLYHEMERLRAELEIDRAEKERRLAELESQKASRMSRTERLLKAKGEIPTESLSNNAIKIGSVDGGDLIEGRPIGPKRMGSKEYYVQIGDSLSIEVWRVPDLTRTVTVRPDGRISMPLVGDLEVDGKALTTIREIITESISEYVIEPQVSIAVRQFGGRKFIILGQVTSPGVYRYEQDISLMEAIALAGGFTEDAKSGQVMVVRGDIKKQPKVRVIKANMLNVLKKGMLTENITVMRNDIIYVGKDFLKDYNEVISTVISPAVNQFIDFFVLREAWRDQVLNRDGG